MHNNIKIFTFDLVLFAVLAEWMNEWRLIDWLTDWMHIINKQHHNDMSFRLAQLETELIWCRMACHVRL